MKQIFFILILVLILGGAYGTYYFVPPAYADTESDSVKKLLPASTVKKPGASGGELIPTKDFRTEVLPQIIKTFLALMWAVSFGVFVYAGVSLVIAQGNEENIKKFKELLLWSIVGLLFITMSYAIVRGIMQLVFT